MNLNHAFVRRVVVHAPARLHAARVIVAAEKEKKREFKGGLPPWKRFQKKGLGRQAEATLESVWARTQWPSDETIAGMWDLHRTRREEVIKWFAEKRRVERGGNPKPNSTSSKKKNSGEVLREEEEDEPKTDWNAEWEIAEMEDKDLINE